MLDRFFNSTMMFGLVAWTLLFTTALALRPNPVPTQVATVVALPTVTVIASRARLDAPALAAAPVGVAPDGVAVAVR